MRRLSIHIFLLILFCCALCPAVGIAASTGASRLSADALLGMGEYRADVAGVEAQRISAIYEQFTVHYERWNVIRDDRLGRYTLMLGYEFTTIDPERIINGVNDATLSKVNASKLYYNGSLLLAPGGLPFRLTLFAKDLHRTTFTDSQSPALPVGNQFYGAYTGHMIDPVMPIDLSNGTHRQFGGTLLVGIRNGSYLGEYRDLLSQVPRLLVDFRQEDVKDNSSLFNPVHSRSRDLAFVSLNKKDNWVHFRTRDYVDYLNPRNDSQNSQVMIGTIDHLMVRKWINLTNWIKLSGDLSYTVEDEAIKVAPVRTYNLNLMTLSKRDNFSSTVFSNFSRETDGRFITKEAALPVSTTVDFNRDTRLRSRFIYEGRNKTFYDGLPVTPADPWANRNTARSTYQDLYLDNLFELQRSRRVIIKPRLEVESRSEANSHEGLAMRVGSEVLSNRALNKAFNWLGGYALTVTKSTDTNLDQSGSFIQNEIYGRVDKDLSRSLRFGGRASLAIGSGEGRDVIAFRIPTLSGALRIGNGGAQEVVDKNYSGAISRGDISLYLDQFYQRMSNRFTANYEFIAVDGTAIQQSAFGHVLRYQTPVHQTDWETEILIGDNAGTPATVSFDYLQLATMDKGSHANWHSEVRYRYTPSRKLGLTLLGDMSGSETDPRTIVYRGSEEVAYRIFTTNGVIRRLAEFTEEVGYEKVTASIDQRNSSIYARLSAAYFPKKYLYGKIRSELVRYMDSSALQVLTGGEFGLDFEKLKFMLSYSQAHKERESAGLPEVTEKRWDMIVKKIF